MKKLVDLHIVGVQKAGTSALAYFLSQHPDICVIEGKEAHVFDQPNFFDEDDPHGYAQERFWKKLPHYNNESVICDATPITIFNPIYLRACFNYNPKAKFILLIRDPVARAVSHYKMMRGRSKEGSAMLSAFRKEKFRLNIKDAEKPWASGSPWRDQSYLRRGLYKKQIRLAKSIIPEQNLLILQQENLLQNHKQTLSDVFNFLNLKDIPIASEKVFESGSVNSHWTDILARIYARCYFTLNDK